jgi:hypothetical protein
MEDVHENEYIVNLYNANPNARFPVQNAGQEPND